MKRVLVLLETDYLNDWVVVKATAETRRCWEACRQRPFEIRGTTDTGRVRPEMVWPRTNKDYYHGIDSGEVDTLLQGVETFDSFEWSSEPTVYIVSNLVSAHVLAAERAGAALAFAHSSNLVEAFKNGLQGPQRRFDIVLTADPADLLRANTRDANKNLGSYADVLEFYLWLERHVGPVRNGPWRDNADAHNFKTLYPLFYTGENQGLIPPTRPKYTMVGSGDLRGFSEQEMAGLVNKRFSVHPRVLVVKRDLSYGGSGVFLFNPERRDGTLKKIEASGRSGAPGLVVQPFVNQIKKHEIKVVFARGLATERGQEQPTYIESKDTAVQLDGKDEWLAFRNGKRVQTTDPTTDEALRTRLYEFGMRVLRTLNTFQVGGGPDDGIPTISRTPARSDNSHRYWARVDVGWNGRPHDGAEFVLNEVTSLPIAWTYNQYYVPDDLTATLADDLDFGVVDEGADDVKAINKCTANLLASSQGVTEYYRALLAAPPAPSVAGQARLRRAATLMKGRILRQRRV